MIESSTYYSYSFECRDRGDQSLERLCLLKSAQMGNHLSKQRLERFELKPRNLTKKEEEYLRLIEGHLTNYQSNGLKTPSGKEVDTLPVFEFESSIPKFVARSKMPEERKSELVGYMAISVASILILAIISFSVWRIYNPVQPSPEQIEDRLYDAWQSAKSNRDYWYRSAEKRYNKDGEISSAFKKYLEADRAADAAWQRYRDYSNSLENNE